MYNIHLIVDKVFFKIIYVFFYSTASIKTEGLVRLLHMFCLVFNTFNNFIKI